jgi:hypothetical protein
VEFYFIFLFRFDDHADRCRPEGVGGARTPPLWLKDGDVVEIGLEGVGTIVNKVEFSKSISKL